MRKSTLCTLLLAAMLAVASFCETAFAQDAIAPVPVLGVCLIGENGLIPEADVWPRYKAGEQTPPELAGFLKAWEESWKEKSLASLTTAVVNQMVMGRDQPGMAGYQFRLAKPIAWKPVAMQTFRGERYVVFEGELDKLPRIQAIRRWVSAYGLYSVNSARIIRVTLTVRGDRDE